MRKLIRSIRTKTKDDNFLKIIYWVENVVAKVLSLALSVLILIALADLVMSLSKNILEDPSGIYDESLVELFGLFLNILIALELLENITAYLKKHIVQVELVIVTSLIAIARKIIIFDFKNYSPNHLLALGVAIICLSVSYWLVKRLNLQD